MGAGLLPFCTYNDDIYFLMQTKFEGRKAGFLNDFGGGSDVGETYLQTAIREFTEETETLFFSTDEEIKAVDKLSDRMSSQIEYLTLLFQTAPYWSCRRKPGKKIPPKEWHTFFIQVEHKDLTSINHVWEDYINNGLSKQRQLFWISSNELINYYTNHPLKLWKRVRQLKNVISVIESIKKETL